MKAESASLQWWWREGWSSRREEQHFVRGGKGLEWMEKEAPVARIEAMGTGPRGVDAGRTLCGVRMLS